MVLIIKTGLKKDWGCASMLAGIQQWVYLMTSCASLLFLECAGLGHKQTQKEHLGKRHSDVLP